jgi:uncharacterized protein YeaO (DUF488 family)
MPVAQINCGRSHDSRIQYERSHAAVYTSTSSPIPWPVYLRRYREEQRTNQDRIDALARRIAAGETITLLCSSSACERESRCHRSVLRELIEAALATARY